MWQSVTASGKDALGWVWSYISLVHPGLLVGLQLLAVCPGKKAGIVVPSSPPELILASPLGFRVFYCVSFLLLFWTS